MKVSVHALFSHNNKWGSKLISKGTAHLAPDLSADVSHTALLINERWVHESTLAKGVQVVSYKLWLQTNTQVARLKLPDCEYNIIADAYRKIKGKKYDYWGLLFLGLAIVPTLWGQKLPAKNRWHSARRYFCCEALGALTGQDYSMKAPIQILKEIGDKVHAF